MDLGAGIWALVPSKHVADDHEGYDVAATVDTVPEGVGVVEVTVRRRQDGPALDPTSLRKVRLGELSEQAVWNAINLPVEGEDSYTLNPASLLIERLRAWVEPSPTGRYALPDDDALRAIATIHNAATLVGVQAQRILMEQLHLPRSTVNYWITQARRRGYLIERGTNHA